MFLVFFLNIFSFNLTKSNLFHHERAEVPNPNNTEVSLNAGSTEHDVRNSLPGCRSGKCPRSF